MRERMHSANWAQTICWPKGLLSFSYCVEAAWRVVRETEALSSVAPRDGRDGRRVRRGRAGAVAGAYATEQ